MYDELVKALRTCAERDSCIGWSDACPYLGTGVCDGKAEKAADAIEELMRRCEQFQYMPPPAWIPVTERLPEIRQVVLITDGIDVGTGWMNQGWWNTSFADIQRDAVTHWMPLPTPPEVPDCKSCEIRKAMARAFDLHWCCEEDCPMECPEKTPNLAQTN